MDEHTTTPAPATSQSEKRKIERGGVSQVLFSKQPGKSSLLAPSSAGRRPGSDVSSKELPIIEWTEIATHRDLDSMWMVLDGIVYDITEYAKHHPGGTDVLKRFAGTDATAQFNAIHPWVNFRLILQNHVVGRVDAPQPR